MSSQNLNEIWQVEVGGQVYEAPFGELGDWINEGSLQPDDKVRKGNLRWIEARRVPSLVPFFNAKEKGLAMPVVVSTVESIPVESTPTPEPSTPPILAAENFRLSDTFVSTSDPIDHSLSMPAEPPPSRPNPDFCAIHTDVPTVFLCDGCATGFCKACPKSYGGTVRTCPFCGALCRLMSDIRQKETASAHRAAAIGEGFGSSDFFNALSHPLKFKTSLIVGAIMFAAFSVGQSVSGLGGLYMMVSAIFCVMLANMLTFGVLANTIENFAQGNLEVNFMPSFDDFELWDDVIHPFFLSIGAYVSSFGPFIVVMLVGLYLVVSSVTSQMNSFQQNVEKIPGTHYYDSQRTLAQSEEVKGVLGNMNRAQSERLTELEEMAAGEYEEESEEESPLVTTADGRKVDRDTLQQEELWAMAQESRKQSLEGAIGKSPETQAKETEAMITSFLSLAAPLVVIGGIFFLWGVFYFPAACAVAGYTRSFMATINPMVGLDTIKRLGGTYVKILFMGLVLVIASTFFGGIVGLILSPFDLPGLGNMPAKFIGALFGFYLSVVFSCILGYAIFKRSDALQIKT